MDCLDCAKTRCCFHGIDIGPCPRYRAPVATYKVQGIPHLCPVCSGHGIVPSGFYDISYQQGEYSGTSKAGETCRTCGGIGYIVT